MLSRYCGSGGPAIAPGTTDRHAAISTLGRSVREVAEALIARELDFSE